MTEAAPDSMGTECDSEEELEVNITLEIGEEVDLITVVEAMWAEAGKNMLRQRGRKDRGRIENKIKSRGKTA